MSAFETAKTYVARGWNPLPLPHKSKIPADKGWQQRVIREQDLPRYFNGRDQNVGVVLGPSSKGLTDTDLDCKEAIFIAPYILPKTGAVFGRESAPASHRLYYSSLSSGLDTATIQFRDPTRPADEVMLLEVRVGGEKGAQTVFPGSVHESGEEIRWDMSGDPARVDNDDLLKQARILACACLFARYWPGEGARHDVGLVLGGFLSRAGMDQAQIKCMVEGAARAAGDAEWKDRVRAAEDAGRAACEGKKAAGFPLLSKAFGEQVARQVAEWLAYKGSSEADATDPEIDRLARLSQLDYARERKDAARKMSIGLPDLDKLVQAKRKKDAADEAERKRLQAAQARQAAGDPEWREKYREGSPKPSLENARLAITSIGVECSLDTFHSKMLFGYRDDKARHVLQFILGEVSDNGVMSLRRLLSDRFGFDLTEKHVRDGAISLALEHCFDPVADMLDKAEGEWDGFERLDRMAAEYLNCEDTPLNAQCLRKTMIAAVARVRNPGCKFDTIPAFESPEGFNKSGAWEVLAGKENFSDEPIIGKGSREVQEQLAYVWVHENADLAGMKKAEVETIKAFASRTEDRARPAYGHIIKIQPRHSIEVATTNSAEYLQSQTGNRRFWPMRVLKSIDLRKLKRDRLQLWGEAAHYQSNGECLTIPEEMWPVAGIEQEKRRTKHPWEDILAEMPAVIENRRWDQESETYTVTETIPIIHIVSDQERVASRVILEHVLKILPGNQTPSHLMRLSEAMQKIGWERHPDGNKITIGGKQERGYYRDLA